MSEPDQPWITHLQRWRQAGLIDPELEASILTWEQGRREGEPAPPRKDASVGWPVRLLILLGSLLLAAGVLLFVAAHWDQLSPLARFAVLCLFTTALHLAGSRCAPTLPLMAVGLHGVGSVSFGASVLLCAQIFHLEVAWSFRWGLLLWSIGVGAGWVLLRQVPQLVLLALLLPGWLGSWLAFALEALQQPLGDWGALPWSAGGLLLALTYFTAPVRPVASTVQRVLMWVGGLLLLPAAAGWVLLGATQTPWPAGVTVPALLLLVWVVLLAGPLALGWMLRRHRVWPLALALLWILIDLQVQSLGVPALAFAWWGIAAIGLMAWGAAEARPERVNVGTAFFAITLTGFYVAEVMGRLERSASLLGLGLLFLAGGWGLNRLRRSLLPAEPKER